MKANGVSLYRISLPVIVIAGVLCLVTFYVNEFLTPAGIEKAEHIRLVEVQKQKTAAQGAFKQNQIWYRSKGAIYNFRVFNPEKKTLKGVTIFYLDPAFRITSRIDAEWAEWKDGQWTLHNIMESRFDAGTFPILSWVEKKVLNIPENPDDFKVIQKDAEQMGYPELKRYIDKMEAEGYDTSRHRVDMYGRLAFPFVTLILVFIGISFSLKMGRSGGVTKSIGAGIVIGFSYWIVHAFSLSLGRSGTIPPLLSAWLANIIFITAAVYLFKKVET
jgi:lipopolysaccharide export system permease protein